MALNLLRVEEINPEYMLERSFFLFQNNSSIPSLEKKVKELEGRRDGVVIENEDQVTNYYRIRQQLHRLEGEMQAFVTKPKHCVPFLQPGRLVKVEHGDDEDFGWGAIVNFQKKANQKAREILSFLSSFTFTSFSRSLRQSNSPPFYL
jgi:ATP-dependent RNA helicase DOB1